MFGLCQEDAHCTEVDMDSQMKNVRLDQVRCAGAHPL